MAAHLRENGVNDEQIIEMNFESYEFIKMTSDDLYQYVKERSLPGKRMYLFFDELQRMAGWGAVLMRGNAGALTEGHNEVRSTGETAVICDGLNTLRGGEQLLFGGAQTHSLQKLMRCCRLVLLKLTHIVAGAERSALRQVLDGERLIRVIVRHIVSRVLNGDLEIAFFLFSEHEHEQNEQLVDRQGIIESEAENSYRHFGRRTMCWQTDSSPVKSSVVTSTTLAPRATTSRILETVFSNSAGCVARATTRSYR